MPRLSALFLLLLFSLPLASFQRAFLTDERVVSYVYTPGKGKLRLFWKEEQGRIFGNAANLKHHLGNKHQLLMFAMNGGMYQEDQSP